MSGHRSQILGDFRQQKSRPITEECTPHRPGRYRCDPHHCPVVLVIVLTAAGKLPPLRPRCHQAAAAAKLPPPLPSCPPLQNCRCRRCAAAATTAAVLPPGCRRHGRTAAKLPPPLSSCLPWPSCRHCIYYFSSEKWCDTLASHYKSKTI